MSKFKHQRPDGVTFSDFLRSVLRARLRTCTQRDVAEATGIPQPRIAVFLTPPKPGKEPNGLTTPHVDRLVDYLGITVSYWGRENISENLAKSAE
jgi:plasmid maintenance system antidote protein VapI